MKYNLKKIKKTLFITLLVFAVPALSIFPSTNSKYITEKENWLVYKTNMNAIYKGIFSTNYESNNSTYEKVGISFSFPKSSNALSTDKDIYVIRVNDKCTINKVTSKGTETKISDNEYKIKYAAGVTTDNIKVEYTCNYNDILVEDNLKDTIKVTEAFNEENNYYNYMFGYFNKSYNEYRTEKPIPSAIRNGNILTIPSNVENKYNEIKSWLTEYFASDANSSAYINYFNQAYNETNFEQSGLLDGFSVVKQADGTLVYTIEKNYKNYALTKYVSATSQSKYFYFMGDSLTDQEANDLFKYYVNKYAYANTSEEYNKIIDYVINKKGGIKTFMVEPNINNYIRWYENKKEIYIPSLDDLLTLLSSTSTVSKEFNYNSSTNMSTTRAQFIINLSKLVVYDSSGNEIALSGDFTNHIKWNLELNNILSTKNTEAVSTYITDDLGSYYPSKVSTPGTGKKYFQPTDTGVKLIVRAYSNGVDTNGVEIILVEEEKDYNLEFNATDGIDSINEILGIIDNTLNITDVDLASGGEVTTSNGTTVTITKTDAKINVSFTSIKKASN